MAFQEPIKVVKPKPKRPSEEQKKTEKTKVELKRRIPPEFQDFGESKISSNTFFTEMRENVLFHMTSSTASL